MNKILVLIILCFVCIAIGCAHKIKHPPTFEDFAYVFRTSDPLINDALQLRDSLQFTDGEKQMIQKTNDPNLLVGAGIQSARSDRGGLELLQQATELSPSSPITWASLVYHEMKIFLYEKDRIIDFESIKKDITRFEEVDPGNSIPLLLKAFLFFKNNEIDKALDLIKSAKTKSKTATYVIDIRRALIDAAEYVGYSSYTSRAYANGFGASTFFMVVLIKDILENLPEDKALMEIFFEFGKQLEQQAKLNIEMMVALVIQSLCLDGLGYDENDVQIKELIQKRTDLRKYVEKLSSIPMNQIPEARWVRFFDESFSLGEQQALKNLFKEHEGIEVIN